MSVISIRLVVGGARDGRLKQILVGISSESDFLEAPGLIKSPREERHDLHFDLKSGKGPSIGADVLPLSHQGIDRIRGTSTGSIEILIGGDSKAPTEIARTASE
jgi:hypothetical protein